MAKVAQPVILSDEERAELERWHRAAFTPQQVALRSRIVLLAGDGKQDLEIAAELGVSRHTASLWRKRYREEGLAGIWQMAPGRGRKALHTEKKVAGIIKATLESNPGGDSHWNCRSMARAKNVSPSTVSRIWREHNLSPNRLRVSKLPQDARFLETLTGVVGLYLNSPDKALVLCAGRKRQVHALPTDTGPDGALAGGEGARLLAGLEILEEKVVGQCYPRHRHQELIKFLSRLDEEFPSGLTLHLVLDNYGTQKPAKVAAWLAKHPRFVLHFVPTSSSWLNQVERWIGELTPTASRRSVFDSAGELNAAIVSFLEHWHESPSPFVWSATVGEIRRQMDRAAMTQEFQGGGDKYRYLLDELPSAPFPDTKHGNKSVKMADVAKAAGVHQTTISRALRSDPSLPIETRRHLTQLADKMGYRRNPLVSALIAERKRGKHSNRGVVLAVLSTGAKPTRWRSFSTTYAQLYRHMQEQADQLGYRLEEFALENPDLSPERLRLILLARGIRGIVVTPMPIEVKAVHFDFTDFAAVALRLHLPHPAIDRVGPDYFSAMSTALDKLFTTGHRRIAFITDLAIDERVRHRSLGAFLVARQSMPKRCLPPKIVEDWNPSEFYDWIKKSKPDAILAPVYKNWRWMNQQLQEGGWKVPEELSLASLDCHTDTPEAGIAPNLKLEASSAIRMLARKVECAEFGIPRESSRLAISGEWRDGELFAPRVNIAGQPRHAH